MSGQTILIIAIVVGLIVLTGWFINGFQRNLGPTHRRQELLARLELYPLGVKHPEIPRPCEFRMYSGIQILGRTLWALWVIIAAGLFFTFLLPETRPLNAGLGRFWLGIVLEIAAVLVFIPYGAYLIALGRRYCLRLDAQEFHIESVFHSKRRLLQSITKVEIGWDGCLILHSEDGETIRIPDTLEGAPELVDIFQYHAARNKR